MREVSAKWSVGRVIASTRVLAAVVAPIIGICVVANLASYSSVAYIVFAAIALGLIWAHMTAQMVRMSQVQVPLRLTKVVTLLIMIVFGYAMMNHALLVYHQDHLDEPSHTGNVDALRQPDKEAKKHSIRTFADMSYFSAITLTTVGYGDISPSSRSTRMLSITEVVAGLILLAVFLSRAVIIPHGAPTRAKFLPVKKIKHP